MLKFSVVFLTPAQEINKIRHFALVFRRQTANTRDDDLFIAYLIHNSDFIRNFPIATLKN